MKVKELVNVIPDGQVIKIRDVIRDKTLFFDDRGFLESDSHLNEKEVLNVISSVGAYDSSEDEDIIVVRVR